MRAADIPASHTYRRRPLEKDARKNRQEGCNDAFIHRAILSGMAYDLILVLITFVPWLMAPCEKNTSEEKWRNDP
jgi:hypothetical protein